MKYVLTLLFLIMGQVLMAQVDSVAPTPKKGAPQLRIFKDPKPKKDTTATKDQVTIDMYKIINYERDTTYLDTTLSIKKDYKYNYLRRDAFELMRFANVGHTYNKLGVDLDHVHFYPSLGASARNYGYMEVEDINYYNVPTPMSDLMFKTTFEQGQLLDATVALNTSRRFNLSLAYKGFRSLGKYLYEQMESGNFRVTTNYVTQNGKYRLRAHIAAQDILGQENGGLLHKEEQFESGDPNFTDRSRIEVQFKDAQNKILGKRYYLDHQYQLFNTKLDSVTTRKTNLTLGHVFTYETKYYQFMQKAQKDAFGEVFLEPIDDKATLKSMYNQFSATFSNTILGSLTGRAEMYHYNYYFNSVLVTPEGRIPDQLMGDELMLGGDYEKTIGGFRLKGGLTQKLSGDLSSLLFNASASYTLKNGDLAKASIHSSSRMPNFNYLLYQSEYENFNWYNLDSFETEKTNSLQLDLQSKFLGNLMVKYSLLDHYSYFASTATEEQLAAGQERAFVRPFQEAGSINYLKVKYSREFRLGKWALDNTVMYQNVTQPNQVLNVPQLVTRNTLYFSSNVFKKAMFLQTGVMFHYFTSYNMDAYHPLLGEFYIQNNEKLGGYPLLDFFINAKVRQTRIFLKAEHFNSSFSGYDFYAAPDYPYGDFVIRFGVVWNFFS